MFSWNIAVVNFDLRIRLHLKCLYIRLESTKQIQDSAINTTQEQAEEPNFAIKKD